MKFMEVKNIYDTKVIDQPQTNNNKQLSQY